MGFLCWIWWNRVCCCEYSGSGSGGGVGLGGGFGLLVSGFLYVEVWCSSFVVIIDFVVIVCIMVVGVYGVVVFSGGVLVVIDGKWKNW